LAARRTGGAFDVGPEGLILRLRVTPNASRDGIDGLETRADGARVLRLRVRAVADRGRANAAVIAIIAEALGVPRSAVAIAAGQTGRLKTVEVRGDGAALAMRLEALFER
jgi:uncharacterized protein (TIGR00251 family)